MSVDEAVARATRDKPELVVAAAQATPHAWGALAARGLMIFRDLTGRRATDSERRAIWAGLWEAVAAARGDK